VCLARETFEFVALLLMLDGVTWTDRKIWSLRFAECVGRWKSLERGRETKEGRYSVKVEGFFVGLNSSYISFGSFGEEERIESQSRVLRCGSRRIRTVGSLVRIAFGHGCVHVFLCCAVLCT
jgi:hypothetical protein